jgi:hypothetical protein
VPCFPNCKSRLFRKLPCLREHTLTEMTILPGVQPR